MMKENWYILFALAEKQEQVCNVIRNQGLHAFLPMMEYYRRDQKEIVTKPMFPGYIFVRAKMRQQDFDQMLFSLGDQKHGLIRQLKREGSTAMRPSEIDFFQQLLNEDGISKMSYGYLQNKKAVITEGAIKPFQEKIVKVDRHNKIAWLDFEFMNRQIQSGLWLDPKYERIQNGTDEGQKLNILGIETPDVDRSGTGITSEKTPDVNEQTSDIRTEQMSEIDIQNLISKMRGV